MMLGIMDRASETDASEKDKGRKQEPRDKLV
jgi:hypothetical protein